MGTCGVIPVDPQPDDLPRVVVPGEVVWPGALFFQASEDPFDKPILFRGVGRDELLAEPVRPTGGPEATALDEEAMVRGE